MVFSSKPVKQYCEYCSKEVDDYYAHRRFYCDAHIKINFKVAPNCSDEVAQKYIDVANSLTVKNQIPEQPTWKELKERLSQLNKR